MRVTAQERISILDPTKIATDRSILYRAFMLVSFFRLIPGTFVLAPRNHILWGRQVNIHVCTTKFSDSYQICVSLTLE
jgi:hypothetical protein